MDDPFGDWKEEKPGPEYARIDGIEFRIGDQVRLQPKARADVFDLALAGRTATIESIEQDFEGRFYFAVTVDDDPGRDMGAAMLPAHRFFYYPEEVEKLNPTEEAD